MSDDRFEIIADKQIGPPELAELMGSVGWGEPDAYDEAVIRGSLAAYPFVAHARDSAGHLVGYISAFSDGAFSTFIGELLVRPSARQHGIGSELLGAVEHRYPGVPIYAHSFDDAEPFFARRGYRLGQRRQSVLFKIPA
jgi:GNAT superfamily N-acetyltransferase